MESAAVSEQRKPGAGPSAKQPAGDNRPKILAATMKRYQYQPDALIEALYTAQELYGYLDLDILTKIAADLKLPPSHVYGVTTFYQFFSLKPRGKHTCLVCMGTACYVRGAAAIVAALEERAGVKAGETTPDGKASILTARCIGACGIAPAVVFDGSVAPFVTPESATQRLGEWLANGS
ncbi:MAG TPA: bidirectional hydrogenase complex protein HoxE [Chthonomonadales bacterium]|nr:bidirectional hydrogenase complex protein HoxE [Chthonomonadales bacterium]